MKGRLISLLKNCKSIYHLQQIHSLIFTTGLHQDTHTLNKLFSVSIHLNNDYFHYSLSIFNHTHHPSLFLYNLLIKSFLKRNSFSTVISLFNQLRLNALYPDNYTYPFVLKAIAFIRDFRQGTKIHAFVVKTGLDCDSYVSNSFMDMYAQLGRIDFVRKLFDEMSVRDNVSWNVMISGCVKCRRFQEAVEVFQRMRVEGNVMISEATVVSSLTACAALRNVEVGKEIHGFIIEKELDFTMIMGNALLDMYCKCGYVNVAREIFDGMIERNVNCWTSMVTGYVSCGELDKARDLFDKSPTRDVVLWTAMINGYVQFNRFDVAVTLFEEMQVRGVKPDKFIVVALLTCCAQLGTLEHGRWIHDYIRENRIVVDAVVGTSLIEMYAKCGCVEKSLEVFIGLKEKDTASWTSIICGLAMNGKTSEALELFEEMKLFGAKPDDVTFIVLLNACSHGGLVEEGRKLFHSMPCIYGIEPNLEHYGCFIDLLGRAGLLCEAEELIRKLPDQKNETTVAIYGSLLSACRTYGNTDMGERIASALAKVKSSDSSLHSLLASIYASADRWEDASKTRSKMKDLHIRKVPGCSAIEVDGIGNQGGVGDFSSFRSKIGLPT